MQEFTRDKDWVDRQYEIERQLRAENEKLGRAMHGDAAIVAELRADRNTAHADRVALEEENVKLRAEVERSQRQLAELKRGLTPNNDDFQLAFLDAYLDKFRTLTKERDEALTELEKASCACQIKGMEQERDDALAEVENERVAFAGMLRDYLTVRRRAVAAEAEVERLRGKIAQFIHGEDHPDMYVTRQEAQDLRAQLATAVKRIDDLEVLLHRWLTTCDDGSCLCGSDDSGYLCPKHATLKVLKETKP